MSRRALGPKVGVVVGRRLPLALRPDDAGAAGHHRARAAVVADREVPPVGQQRLLVGAEDPADVGGVVERGVEVDVVADLDGQVQRHVGQRDEVGLDQVALGLVGEQAGDPAAEGAADPTPLRHQQVERRLLEHVVHVEHLGGRDRGQVEHEVADPDADPRLLARPREHAVRQVVDVEEGAGGSVDPGGGHGGPSRSPRASRSSSGSVTEQEPNEVNQRRAPARSAARASSARPRAVAALEGLDHVVAPGAVEGVPGGEQDVEEARGARTRRRRCGGRRCAGRPCT